MLSGVFCVWQALDEVTFPAACEASWHILLVVFAPRSTFSLVCPWMTFVFLAACGGSQGTTQTAAGAEGEISCPAPIGTIARENCAEIGEDFGALNVEGALKTAGTSKGSEERIEAIRAAGDLATRLKERRVDLCDQYNACKMTLADHNTEDERLAAIMASLIKLWNERQFLDSNGVSQFQQQVKALTAKLDGQSVDAQGTISEAKPSTVRVPGDKLGQISGAGVTFAPASGAIKISATSDGSHDALRASVADLKASSANRYLLHVSGSYTPATAALIKPGDDLTIRFKYRAAQAGEVYVALRSLEDPDAGESTSTLPIAKAGPGEQQATLTAAPGSSGFYVGIGSRTTALDLDDVEVVRGGSVILSALAEAAKEANVETTCSVGNTKPITGKGSFVCAARETDALTIGRPRGHLFIAVRNGTGDDRSILRTLSLEGGRSIDAKLDADSTFVIGIVGQGSATIQAVEVKKL